MDLPFAQTPEDLGINGDALQRIRKWQDHLVSSKRLPFTQVVIGRRGKVAYFETTGFQDVNAGIAATPDTICRLHSMSKPITSCALMMLYEEAKFLLTDPVHLYLGERWHKKNMAVYKAGDADSGWTTEPCRRSITIRDVLCHTSGLSYGFDAMGVVSKVDGIYAKLGLGWPKDSHGLLLADFVDRLAEAPLQCQPGSAWHYGYNTEVCGRLVEVISGQPLDQFLRERLFGPLRMPDTGFAVPPEKQDRFARTYMRAGTKASMFQTKPGSGRHMVGLKDITHSTDGRAVSRYAPGARFLEAGGGLVGTISDYARFAQMLLNGGELDGRVVLSRKTIEWMSINHIPDNKDMSAFAKNSGGYSEGLRSWLQDGVGFGLGFSVVMDAARSGQIGSVGTLAWGGAASTAFWCDPMEDLFVVFTTQFMYRDEQGMPLREWLGSLVYGCLTVGRDPSGSSLLRQGASKL